MSEVATQINVPPVPAELVREPLVQNNRSFGWISDRVSAITEGKAPKWWWAAFIPSVCFAGFARVHVVLPNHHGRRCLG